MRHPVITRAAIAASCGAFLVACQKSEPLRPDPAATMRRAIQLVVVPFQAVTELALLPPQLPPAGRCSNPAADVVSAMTGTLHGTHLGTASIIGSHCLDYATLLCSDGRLTINASNGDVLTGTYTCSSGSLHGSIARWEDQVTFTGGTGRFASAAGGAEESGWVDYATGQGTSTLHGTLSFAASDRVQR